MINNLFKGVIPFLMLLAFTLQSCDYRKGEQKSKPVKKTNEPDKTLNPSAEIIEEFYQAIFDNNSQKVRQMLATKFPANYEPKNKIPPLQAVIWTSDNLALAKLFVEGGAKINKPDNPTVLVAAEYKRLEILQYLVEKGSDIKDNASFNTAGFHQFYEGAKYLLLNGANKKLGDIRGKFWVFHQAVRKADYEVLNALSLTPKDWDYNDYDGATALIIAIKSNDIGMVKYLLKKGVNKNKRETFDGGDRITYGKKPIEIAKENNFKELVGLLQ